MSDLYTLLGIEKTATADEIKKGYRKMMAEHHPDKNGGDHSDEFYACKEAYDILSDPLLRRKYDDTGVIPDKESGMNIAKEFAALFHTAIEQVGEGEDLIELTKKAVTHAIKDTQTNISQCNKKISKLERVKNRIICKTDDQFLLQTMDVRINDFMGQINAHKLEIKKMEGVIEYACNYEFIPEQDRYSKQPYGLMRFFEKS